MNQGMYQFDDPVVLSGCKYYAYYSNVVTKITSVRIAHLSYPITKWLL